MTVSRTFICLLIWVGLGVIYNLVSLVMLKSTGHGLAPTDPVSGLVFMVVAGGVISAGMLGYKRFYSLAIIPTIALLAYSGVYVHMSSFVADATLPEYESALSCLLAIVINLFGLSALLYRIRVTNKPI